MNDKSIDAFRTISEVADDLDLPQHVLRFWETRFGQIRPMKRAGGRRYYRSEDVELLKGIRHLLYDKGYTIRGVQKILKESGNRFVAALGRGEAGLGDRLAAIPETDMVEDDRLDIAEEAVAAVEPDEFDELDTLVGMPGGTDHDAEQGARRESTFAPRVEPASESRPKGLAGLIRREPAGPSAGQGRALPKESVEALDRVILQLLECKRLLDQVR